MRLTDLGSPSPRKIPRAPQAFRYPVADSEYLPVPQDLPTVPFFNVIGSRRTRRRFAPIGLRELATVLWFSQKELEAVERPDCGRWSHRYCASAGGCHPIDILVLGQPTGRLSCSLYDPVSHSLGTLAVADAGLAALDCAARNVLDAQGAAILWLVAQPERTLSRYECGDSLILRDAGVLLGQVLLVAEALGLAACPLGITGEPHVSHMLASGGKAIGVGACVVGRRA